MRVRTVASTTKTYWDNTSRYDAILDERGDCLNTSRGPYGVIESVGEKRAMSSRSGHTRRRCAGRTGK